MSLLILATVVAILISIWLQRQRTAAPPHAQLPFQPLRAMVFIPAGEFLMGSTNGAPEEQPVHRVRVNAFWMDRYEVTNAEYEQFDPEHRTRRTAQAAGDHHPVVNVSWHDALAYCAWRSRREGVPEGTYRLPTEAEWEYAARGGLAQQPYPWGTAQPDADDILLAAHKRRGATNDLLAHPLPVGSFLPNGFGLYDMAGNVWEWCMDWYAENTYAARAHAGVIDNPQGPTNGLRKVWRGGSWMSEAERLRVSARGGISPQQWMATLGFRCVRPAE
ncbi:MAG: formylglycine-generating enzyme family protein [bacterium]|nr:formylglycine-generating enzyme family protein [bacterium]